MVYANDTDTFGDVSEVEDVKFEAKDEKFYKQFSTGAVPIRWQKEMIDTGVFDELDQPRLNGHSREAAWESRTCAVL